MKPVIAIPSMNHPDVNIFSRLSSVNLDKYIFVRREQYGMYESWEEHGYRVIKLPKWVDDIGSTRKAIVQYFHNRDQHWVFMLDDDIAYVGNCELRPEGWKWEYTHKEKTYFKTSVFKRWFNIARKYDLSLSSPCHRFHDHNRHGNRILINKAACIQCVLLHTPDVISVGNYKRMRECGNEDYSLQYFLMNHGYSCGMIGNLLYDAPAIGGADKYPEYIETFKTNVCNDPTYITTKTTRSGVPSIQFVWKNWGGKIIEMEDNNGQS